AALVVAWIHGCIGLWFWLRLKPVYRRVQPLLFSGALLIPVLALLGFFISGREAVELAQDPAWLRTAIAEINAPNAAAAAYIASLEDRVILLFFATLAGVLLARA